MRNKGLVKILGVFLASLLVVSSASVVFASEEPLKRFGIKISGMYVMPDDDFDKDLKALKLGVDDAIAPKLELEYFFTKNISTELVLAFTKHDITSDGDDIGSVWLLPPSLFVKYHPLPDFCVSPYVGFGMNLVIPFDEKLSGAHLDVDTSVGWAAKVGFDVPVMKTNCVTVYWNVDAIYYNTETEMTIRGVHHSFDLDINPWIISTGVGLRF